LSHQFYIIVSLLIFSTTQANSQYPLIQPVSVEHSLIIKKATITTPKKEIRKAEEKKVVTQAKSAVITLIDTDLDGVSDELDKCSNTTKEFSVDKNGCPSAISLNINFKYKKYNLSSSSKQQVKKFAQFLQENKTYHVIIYGYTDDAGNYKSNKILSQNRANAIKKELIKNKIKSIRITAIGRSQESPIADNSDEEGRAKNRRIEIELLK